MIHDNIMGDKPAWYAACNGVTQFSWDGYYCDSAYLSPSAEKKTRDDNRRKVLTYVNSLIRKQGIVSTREISEKLGIIEDFVIETLENEFGELDSDEQNE